MSNLSPELAKMASQAIRELHQENTKLSSEQAELREKVATLEKERDCRRLAADMAERGLIDVNDVDKTASSLKEEDLEVVKQAMTWRTPENLTIGEPTSSSMVAGDDVDPIVRCLLEDD
jgi:hypothetical protein